MQLTHLNHPGRCTTQENPLACEGIAKSKPTRIKKRQSGGPEVETKDKPLEVVPPERAGLDHMPRVADITGDENEGSDSSPNLNHSDGLSLEQPVADTARSEIEMAGNGGVSEDVSTMAKLVVDDEKEILEAVSSPVDKPKTTKNVKEEQQTTVEPEAEIEVQSEERKQPTAMALTHKVQVQPSPISTSQAKPEPNTNMAHI